MTNVSAGVAPLGYTAGMCNLATGQYTGDGTAGTIAVALGFTPKYVKLINMTDGVSFEYIEGMAASDTISFTESADMAVDTNGTITTNATIATATENALNAPGSQSADLGVSGTTTVSYIKTDKTKQRLNFVAGASGARANVSAKSYVWMAIG